MEHLGLKVMGSARTQCSHLLQQLHLIGCAMPCNPFWAKNWEPPSHPIPQLLPSLSPPPVILRLLSAPVCTKWTVMGQQKASGLLACQQNLFPRSCAGCSCSWL